jgi:uncharacterized SAM-binding protein YcdF (DUF218 family)
MVLVMMLPPCCHCYKLKPSVICGQLINLQLTDFVLKHYRFCEIYLFAFAPYCYNVSVMAQNKHEVDAIVALGLQLEPDGSPRPELFHRVSKSVELFQEFGAGERPFLIMTGHRSAAAAVVPPHPESTVLRNIAIGLGVPEEKIIEEPESLCTWGNALFTRNILESLGLRRLIVVSTDYHLRFGMMAFHHTLGQSYDITGLASSHPEVTPEQSAYEMSASTTAREIIESTPAGNKHAIQSKLASLVPVYAGLFAHEELALAA